MDNIFEAMQNEGIPEMEERVETKEEKIAGLQAQIDQMKRMIEENIRKIAEGDDVEGRTFLKGHLEAEVAHMTAEIAELNKAE